MSSDTAIRVEKLSKCYQIYESPQSRLLQMLVGSRKQYFREFWALNDVSFTIQRGETVGIIGRNGSGKSTLLQMICGTVSPSLGSVNTNGRIAALLELGAGFNPEFTGRENVLLNAAIMGVSNEEMNKRMSEVLSFSELGEFIDHPVKTYSSGMYARLAFSTAIHVDPDILIVDEALAVGDARFVAKCMRRIKDIQEQGATILFVSHDVSSVRTLCQRAIWLDKGKLVADGEVFPVTGRFMEFMFQDENTNTPPTPPQKIETEIVALAQQNTLSLAEEQALTRESSEILQHTQEANPVTHWGSCKGIIRAAYICNEKGERKDIFSWGEDISIVINVNIPPEIQREHLSIAFSIKDLKGTDLIVSTTRDIDMVNIPHNESFQVSFKMTNCLVTGKYLLVAAVENREYRDIHYYEYIEGAHYFASLSDQRFFGIFQPKIEQHIEV